MKTIHPLPAAENLGATGIRDILGHLRSWDELACEKAGQSSGAAFFEQLWLASRQDYVAYRDQLVSCLREMATRQRQLAQACRAPGGDPEAQSRRASGARIITGLIRIRRAGKVWSARRSAESERSAA